MPPVLHTAETTLDALERLADAGLPAQDLLEQVTERLRRVVPTDGEFVATTDPETTFSTGLGVVRTLPVDQCRPTWDYELLVPDVLKFTDIARSGRAVADVHDATAGRPDRSPRFRQFSAATGYRAEVRLTFAIGGATYGIAQLNRMGAARFSDAEKRWLERAARPIARGLRRAVLAPPSGPPAAGGPGIVLLDRDGRFSSMTAQAEVLLDQLHHELRTPDGALPFYAHALAVRARAALEDGVAPPRARLRTRQGAWLLMHCATFAGTDHLALIIEPAKGSDVAPLIVEAYGLSARELDVAQAVARGLRTTEVAEQLHLSPHTVRDHLKAIFEKVGVSSRGELVHKLFSEHYAPAAH